MAGYIGIVWHGRGGQGAFTASKVLGAAYSLGQGGSALSFPSFGPERRGAPVRAFTKLSEGKVEDRSEISDPDFAVYLDRGLIGDSPSGNAIIVNSPEDLGDDRFVCIDGSGISKAVSGVPIANIAMVGALAGFWGGVSLESVFAGIDAVMPERLREGNKRVAEAAYEAARGCI